MRRPEWWPVAAWELTRMAKKADFVISTLLAPILLIGVSFLGQWMKQRQDREVHRIAVVAPAPLPPLEHFAFEPAGALQRGALLDRVRRNELDGAVVIPAGYVAGDSVELIVRRPRPGWGPELRAHVQAQARLARAGPHGLDSAALGALDAPVAFAERAALPGGRSRGDRMAAFGLPLLLIMSLFVTGMYMAVGISGEKQARVTEVIVSAIRPESWMDGKIVAYTVIGLFQAVVWAGALLAAVVFVTYSLPPSVNPLALGVYLLFALLGFAFYASLFAFVMATVKDLQSTSKIQAYLFFVPMVPFFFIQGVLRTPDAPWVVALGLFPPFAPMLQPMRLSLGAAHAWEIALSLALLAAAVHFMRRAAGHAFRIGMLMYGKELTLPELWRWAREK